MPRNDCFMSLTFLNMFVLLCTCFFTFYVTRESWYSETYVSIKDYHNYNTHGLRLCPLVAITGTIFVPCHVEKYVQLFYNRASINTKNMGVQSSDVLQCPLKTGHQDNSPSNGCQGNMLNWNNNNCAWNSQLSLFTMMLTFPIASSQNLQVSLGFQSIQFL